MDASPSRSRGVSVIRSLALVLALLAQVTSASAAEDASPPADFLVILRDAVWHEGKSESKRDLRLRVERDRNGWAPVVIGDARAYNRGDYYGKLLKASSEGTSIRLSVRMRLEPDPWAGGEGLAEYRIQLNAAGDSWEGAWEGALRGETAKGTARGTFVASPLKGFVPPAPGEHPRLLIRKADIPRLREKARTAWGKQMMERLAVEDPSRSSMAAAQALLYVLTGDLEHARQAQRHIQADIDGGKWFETGQVHDPAAKAVESLIAYDLIFDTCDEPFKAQMRELLKEQAPFFYRGADCPLYNSNDGSNWSAMYNSGAGMVALFVAGEPAKPFVKPAEPEIPALKEPDDLKVGKDVPVVKLESGKHWTTWLWAGPFHAGKGLDALESIGGAARARPESGTKVTWKICAPYATAPDPQGAVEERVFAPLDPKHLVPKAHADRYPQISRVGAVDFAAATRLAGLTTSYVYAVMENDRPGIYRIDLGRWKLLDAAVHVAGRRLRHGDLVRLDKGRFPVLGSARIAHVNSWTKIAFHVRFLSVSEEQAAAWLAKRKETHRVDLEDWQTDPYGPRWLGVTRQKIANWTFDALGDMGWNTEGEAYTQHSYRLVFPFAHCYRNATGKDLSPGSGLHMALPLYAARTIFGPGGARMTGFGPGGGPLGVENFARGFSHVPERYRPAVLWAWNRTQALADAGAFQEPNGLVDKLDPLSAAFRFVTYPLDIQEQNPSGALSRVTVEPRRGGYVFRNGWKDENDFVTTVFLDSRFAGGGWNSMEAGDLRISGLGVDWTVRGMGWGHKGTARQDGAVKRSCQTVLLLSEPVEGGQEASQTYFEPKPDGSGILSMDLSDLYTSPQPGPKGNVKASPVRPGARVGYDLGIRGMRSIAVDYSGASGAPGLVAVVDRVSGTTGKNTWQVVTEKEHTVSISGNRFTLRAANGATLQATVVSPPDATIGQVRMTVQHEINYHGGHKTAPFTRTVVNVPGGEFFFVVMTIQSGAAPEVKADGRGPDAKAILGKRTVRFDGAKLVLE